MNPNRRVHFQKKAKKKKKFKDDCHWLAKQYPKPIFEDGDISLCMTFHGPTERKYDLDNLLSSMKSGLDGIAEHWGIDDSRFNPITVKRGNVRRGGSVEIVVH